MLTTWNQKLQESKERIIQIRNNFSIKNKVENKTKKSNELFDIVIVAHSKDKDTLKLLLESIQRYIKNVGKIFLVSKEDFIKKKVIHVDERHFEFQKDDASTILAQKGCPNYKFGWYYQQLLKLYCCKVIRDLNEYYLILDADIIFINQVSFFNKDKPYFSIGKDHHELYFDHMKRLLPGLTKQTEYSGISHHMLFKKSILLELIHRVEMYHKESFWRAFLKCVVFTSNNFCCASEYEIYFNYALKFHPHVYELRNLKWDNTYESDNKNVIKKKRQGYAFVCRHDYDINDHKSYVIE
jgi:hypothetical protein